MTTKLSKQKLARYDRDGILLVWDTLVKGYFKLKSGTTAYSKWRAEMKKMLSKKGYGETAFDCYLEIMEAHRPFLERHSSLFMHPFEKRDL